MENNTLTRDVVLRYRLKGKKISGTTGRFLILSALLGLPLFGQTSFWTPASTPSTPEVTNDTASVNVGLKFYSDVAGIVSGVRFYKGPHNTGTHVGTLWTGAGAKLASVTFAGESASGWQQASFSTPVGIAANATYVISYLAPKGYYAESNSYSWSALSATPLHVSGTAPGVYAYGSTTTFPTGTWNSSNYWVDVVFSTSAAHSVSGIITGGAGATVTLSGATNATTTADSSGSYSFAGVPNGTDTVTPSKAGLTFSPASQTITMNGANIAAVNFTTTAANSVWSAAIIPGTPQVTNDTSSVTLGLKFYSDVPGSVTAVRFYKGPNNNGIHVGSLWTSSGTNLASVTFTNETASGWQQANLSSPVSIAANTAYVISYLAPKGYYAADQAYSWSTVSAAPLHVSGSSPGVFVYGTNTSLPSQSWNSTNYWVDLVFVPGNGSGSGTYAISGTVSGSAATLTLSGTSAGSTTVANGGTYTFSGLTSGSYVVAPSQAGYLFSPATASVTVNGANVTGANFTATPLLSHTVSLTWVASVSPNISGYNVYRGTNSGGPYAKINSGLLTGSAYVDSSVKSGLTYYYVATAVDSSNNESGYSNEAGAAVPVP